MKLKALPQAFSVCKIESLSDALTNCEYCFTAKTDEECSLVCPTDNVPAYTLQREDGWRAFRIEGVLDFSLVGILAKISALLSENNIGIFAVSTYNTDYIFTKRENFVKALKILSGAGYETG